MKICVHVNDKKRRIYLPTSLLYMRPVISLLIRKSEIEISDENVKKITEKIAQYVAGHKGQCITDVDVLSSQGEYVHVDIYL